MRLGKTKKRRSDQRLILERRMVGLVQSLVLDRSVCNGCRDCQWICPREAISSSEPVLRSGGLTEPIVLDVDEEACHFCGQCAAICPMKAFTWRENEEETPTLQRRGILPALREEIQVEVTKCRPDCLLVCERSCPVQAIKVLTRSEEDGSGTRIEGVEVDRKRCFYCHKCEDACPYRAISVRQAREGMVLFQPTQCPEGCHACADVCPSTALYREDGVVQLNDRFCIYCRACQQVCPAEAALEIRRERVLHHPVRSHLWVEMLEKLISRNAKLRSMEEVARRKHARAYRTRID